MSALDDEDDIIGGINVTPLVDVCLVLVIIFMVTAPMMADPKFKVELPKAQTGESEESKKIAITLGRDGRLALEENEYSTLAALEPDLKLLILMSDSKRVVLRADEEALHGRLTDLMSMAKEAGAVSLTIATVKDQ